MHTRSLTRPQGPAYVGHMSCAQVRYNNNARVVGLTSLASIQTSIRVFSLMHGTQRRN